MAAKLNLDILGVDGLREPVKKIVEEDRAQALKSKPAGRRFPGMRKRNLRPA